MNREQAVNIAKKILVGCYAVEGKSLKLLPPQEDGSLPHTFQIYIELRGHFDIQGCVANIAKNHNLAVTEKDGWLIEAGFEYVTDFQDAKIFRKRKL